MAKGKPEFLDDDDIAQLVREYVAMEVMREVNDHSGKFAVRVLGEVLANRPYYSERVVVAAGDVARELLTPKRLAEIASKK